MLAGSNFSKGGKNGMGLVSSLRHLVNEILGNFMAQPLLGEHGQVEITAQ
jgi:hypothetical protein